MAALFLFLTFFLLAAADGSGGGPDPPARVRYAAPEERPSNHSRCFIVKVRRNASAAAVGRLFPRPPGKLGVWDSAFHGFYHCAGTVNETQLLLWANDSRVEYVEEDRKVRPAATQAVSSVLWNLDRIDQRYLPLDGSFTYNYTGEGVFLYVVDSGVRSSHEQLQGRVLTGQSFAPGTMSNDTSDCYGHGTHVTGTAAGTTVGVAKGAYIVPVRVFDCDGTGTVVGLINALNWITTQPKPGVINLSLYTSASQAIDAAVLNVIAQGYHVVVAAGDQADDACQYSPSRVTRATTVGWTTSQDALALYASYGPCVDLFSPGSNIYSAWYTGDSTYKVSSGSSMATALASGVVAAYLEANASMTPAAMQAFLKQVATSSVLSVGSGSPNLLLYSQGSFAISPASPDTSGDDSNKALYWLLVAPGVLLPCTVICAACLVVRHRRQVWEARKRRAEAAGVRRPRPSWGVRSSSPSLVYGIPIRISVEPDEAMAVVDGRVEGAEDLVDGAVAPLPAPAPPEPSADPADPSPRAPALADQAGLPQPPLPHAEDEDEDDEDEDEDDDEDDDEDEDDGEGEGLYAGEGDEAGSEAGAAEAEVHPGGADEPGDAAAPTHGGGDAPASPASPGPPSPGAAVALPGQL